VKVDLSPVRLCKSRERRLVARSCQLRLHIDLPRFESRQKYDMIVAVPVSRTIMMDSILMMADS